MDELTLFAAVLAAADDTQRQEILDRECRDNSVLRQRIEALLQAHGQTNELLDQPLAPLSNETLDLVDSTAQAGTVIAGRYTLIEKIGEGGMGTVWRAKQSEPVKRAVAIKLIKAGMDSRQVLNRFNAERQALALMDHPHIAKVLDGGLHEQRPFFVMELVKGTPITEYCDGNRLPPAERLRLFIPVCEAIQHAHQKGIIHRDIKPNNVLVALYDDKPIVKVIDFGVAKATGGALTEQSIDTGFGSVVGTPQYMSPEQATFNNLDIDTRSDVYALGVLLYELLTGTPPFSHQQLEKLGLLEMLRVVREEEPQRPSTKLSTAEALPTLSANRATEPKQLTGLLKNELDWIVMKALDKDRVRRYQTAAGFASDVQRYLEGEAIEAHPPSAAYRMKKLLRKNKGPVLAGALILLTLTLGILGIVWQAVRATNAMSQAQRARAQAENARVEAEIQRQRAQENESKALQSVEAQILAGERETLQRIRAEKATEKAEEILNAMLSNASRESLATQSEISEDQKTFLTGALAYYRELTSEKSDAPTTRARIAHAAFRVGLIEERLGRTQEAATAFGEARDLYQKLVEDSPDALPFQQQLALCFNNLGNAASDLGTTDQAESNYREAIRIQQRIAGGPLRSVPEYQSNLALSHNNLGALLRKLGRESDAETEYQNALAIRKQLATNFPENTEYLHGLAKTHNHLGILSRILGKRDEAETHYAQALAIRQQLATNFPLAAAYRHDLAASYLNLGNLRRETDDWTAAEEHYHQALPILETLTVQYPSVPEYQRSLGTNYTHLGSLLRRDGRLSEAEGYLKKAVAIQERQVSESPADPELQNSLAQSHMFLGGLLQAQGRLSEAENEYQRICQIQEKLVTEYPTIIKYQTALGGIYLLIGSTRYSDGREAESVEPLGKAIQIFHRCSEKDVKAKAALGGSYIQRAQTFNKLKQFQLALKDWDSALPLSPPENHLNIRTSRAISQLQNGQISDSLAEIEALLTHANANHGVKYGCACYFALASTLDNERKQEFEERSIHLLRQSIEAGFKNAAHIKKDRDLDAIRNRDDFQAILIELEQAGANQ